MMATRKSANQQSVCLVRHEKVKFRTPTPQEFCKFNTCSNVGRTVKDSVQFSERIAKKVRNYEKENWIAEFNIMTGHCKSPEVTGHNSHKYFQRPIIPYLVQKTQSTKIPVRFEYDALNDVTRNAQSQCYMPPPKLEPYKSIGTQTDYRDSESQTVPWEPPYTIKAGHVPEALTIAHFTWNHGLPAGVHEVEIINRMRMKKAWEEILPPMDTEANIQIRTEIISALEVDEWAFRESEIQAIMDRRLKLMADITQTRETEQRKRVQDRFTRLSNTLSKRRSKEVNVIRHNLRRELRKLYKKHQDRQLLSKRCIINEHADPSSELYAPQMRFGEHPQRRHEVIRKDVLKDSCIESAGAIDTMPSWLPTYEELKKIKPNPKPADLCIRETRWTEEKLKELHADLKAIRLNVEQIETSSLIKRKYKSPPLPSTPYRARSDDLKYVRIDQLSTVIQKTIRGRAIQCMMFEGRDRCRELIEELQSTSALEEQGKKICQKEKMQMIELQRVQNDKSVQEDRLCEVLNSLEGMTISGMLDFLSKELIRLQDERRVHAFALLAERERAMREAAEAGRRQLEYNRRREFDEMFRQIIKINQDSVETYLEDIVKDGIEWVSSEAAKEYILELSDKVDSISKYAVQNASGIAREEMVANMIYNFVLPEVEKHSVRRSIRMNQQCYLQNAHAAIYQEILDLPPVQDRTLSDEESQYPETFKGEDSIEIFDSDKIEEICPEMYSTDTEWASTDMSDTKAIDVEQILENLIADIVPEDGAEIIHSLLESIIAEVTGSEESAAEQSHNSSADNDNFHE